jgi:hypothetical protein
MPDNPASFTVLRLYPDYIGNDNGMAGRKHRS